MYCIKIDRTKEFLKLWREIGEGRLFCDFGFAPENGDQGTFIIRLFFIDERGVAFINEIESRGKRSDADEIFDETMKKYLIPVRRLIRATFISP